jgi:methyl-accepting chemotaxis protein
VPIPASSIYEIEHEMAREANCDYLKSRSQDGTLQLGGLARKLNVFFERLQASVKEIGLSAKTVSPSAEELSAVSTQLAANK